MKGNTALLVSGQVVGVSVHEDGPSPALRYVRLQRHGQELRILGHGRASDPADLNRQCGTRAPLALNFLTPRCLHRVVERAGPLEASLNHAFPGAQLGDIHATGWQADATTGVSMMRKEQAAALVDQLHELGYRLVDLHIGPWTLLHLRGVSDLGVQDEIGGHRFQFAEGQLTGYQAPTTEQGVTLIGTDEVPNEHLLALSAAWAQLVPDPALLAQADVSVSNDRVEERARTWYERGSLALVAVLLLLLGADALIKSTLRDRLGDPATSTVEHATLTAANKELEEQVRSREALAEQLGLGRTDRFAERAARVLAHVPETILLDRVTIDPLVADLRPRERPTARTQRIRIIGSCPDGAAFNAWMNVLRGTEGVQNVRLISFTGATPRQGPSFEIELTT